MLMDVFQHLFQYKNVPLIAIQFCYFLVAADLSQTIEVMKQLDGPDKMDLQLHELPLIHWKLVSFELP